MPALPEFLPDFQSYSKIIVYFSGGKDSIASFLCLLEAGVPASKVELWHHDIDGNPKDGEHLMDWASTPAYCKAFAKAFGAKIFFSYREGGFLREMLRNNTRTAPTVFETPDGIRQAGGINGPLGTRRQFPQVSPNLSSRWCSAALKIDVAGMALRNQDRFNHTRTLVLSGERAGESTARAHYAEFEPDRTDNRDGKLGRHVDHWRPVHKFSEAQVWDLIAKYRINMHPAYRLGWGRLSCMKCIFGNRNQWASAAVVDPEGVLKIAEMEAEFGKTIDRQGVEVLDKVAAGTPYKGTRDVLLVAEANDPNWDHPIVLEAGEWVRPSGAFGECAGPE